MSLLSLFKQNKLFFIGFLLLVCSSIYVLVVYSKIDGFYLLNTHHSPFFTTLFIYFTYLGDGFFVLAIGIILLLFKKYGEGIMVLSSYVISGFIAQVLKYFVVEPRPAILLKDSTYQYFIEDVTLHNLHAFPSGHTASAFALAAVLSFAAKRKEYSLLLLVGAILVGYSRIYLAQHFLNDVLAGAVIGCFTAIFLQLFLAEKSFMVKYNRKLKS